MATVYLLLILEAASVGQRSYSSPKREAQAAATRELILEATIELLGSGVASLTVPAVARRAGVSTPTVYRYFSGKEALVDAAADYVRASLGVPPDRDIPPDRMQYYADQREIFKRMAAAEERTIGAVVATFGRGDGPMSLADRCEALAPVFESEIGHWADTDRERFLAIASILGSSVGATALAQFEIRGDDASDLVEWVLTRLIGSTKGG